MGREIRRVPKGWEHPKNDSGDYEPLLDRDYETDIAEWINNHNLWLAGEHSDQKEYSHTPQFYAEWNGNPPDIEYHRPKWTDKERCCLQVYETVSEGTPVSPVFENKEDLIEYLVKYGDFWSQQNGDVGFSREAAEAFVKSEWAPSMVFHNGVMKKGIESMTDI